MFRKRYTVVVVGLGGSSAAQRSEISHFRRERDAVAAATDERDRLSVAHGSLARNYRVLVERDGVVVEFAPGASEEPPSAGATGPAGGPEPEEDATGDTGAMPVPAPVDAPQDHPAAAGAEPPADDAPPPAPVSRLPSWDDVPSGPVPDEVLRYFESAVEREQERRRRRGAPAHDGDGEPGEGSV